MGLISKTVIMKWNSKNKKWFEEKGHKFTKYKDEFTVSVNDLTKSSSALVNVKCDCEDCKNPYLDPMKWANYLICVKEHGKYYCNDCAKRLFSGYNIQQTRLKNSKSFEIWCIEKNRQDILIRWDYDLNNIKPNELSYGSSSKNYYFKCPRGIHKSELKNIKSYTSRQEGKMECMLCNSFAQWGIDNIGEDFLEKYWDWEKNNELGINPWEIARCANKPKIWIKCQEKNYHSSYDMTPGNFINNHRCPYCNNRHGKIHPLDSLGKLFENNELLYLWSEKNKKSSYEYAPKSHEEVWWKCPEGKHEDYFRNIASSNSLNFRCPECQYSQGEERISNDLINRGFIKISQEEFEQLIDKNKYSKNYLITQMKFNSLVGLKGGLLSYDFYIPKYNLLIEYQGEQHERYIPGFHSSKKDFEKQQEHDRRKREYAQKHNINLLEIWHYDFNNIETILEQTLKSMEVMSA